MSAGVVVKIDNKVDRDGWIQLLEAFAITEVYELPGLGHSLDQSIKIERLMDLVKFHDADLVVLAARAGDFVKGDQSLFEFEHPEEAIYIFGGTMTRLHEVDLRGLRPAAAKVYIIARDLYPAQAGAIVLWDRLVKRRAL